MLLEPSDRELESLYRLSRDPDFPEVLGWLARSLEETRKENDILSGIELTRSQGCAITLSRFQEICETADELLEDREARKQTERILVT